MAGPIYVEWLNANAGRAYPFRENSSRVPVDGSGNPITAAALPNYVVVDAVIAVPNALAAGLYVHRVTAVGTTVAFVLRSIAGDLDVATVAASGGTHVFGQAYPVVGIGDWFDIRGWMVLGDIARIPEDIPPGTYTYPPDALRLEPRTVRPSLQGVRSLRVETLGELSTPLYDNVTLVAGENVRFEYDDEANAIVVHAEPNESYREDCECEEALTAATNIVRTVNGIPIEDVIIEGDGSCVEIRVEGNKVIISDKCSEPCCGCPELELVTESVKVIERSLSTLEEFSSKLAERVDNFVTAFVLSVSV